MNLFVSKETLDREWRLGARNRRSGLSLSQSYKHIDRYDHDARKVHTDGWRSMDQYLYLKKVDEEFTKNGE
jgi:hypothetical protein